MRPEPDVEAVSLEEKLAFLREPRNYPEPTSGVRAIETHISWVFLTDRHAYKLKKPVATPYLDFRTLAARRRDCEEEVRLNRRLAPGVYLGVVALWRGPAGLAWEGEGAVVEWLVKMRRLPEARMLDRLVAARAVGEAEVHGLGVYLARFYARAACEPMNAAAYAAKLLQRIELNAEALQDAAFGLDVGRMAGLADRQRAWLAGHADVIAARVACGRIVEGHGDLRPEHVCMLDPPVVFDCLEFHRDFRIVDPVDELGSLAVDCERLGDPRLGEVLLAAYAEASGDAWPEGLLHFYASCQAALRARLAILHLREPGRGSPEGWRALAQAYGVLAEDHIARA